MLLSRTILSVLSCFRSPHLSGGQWSSFHPAAPALWSLSLPAPMPVPNTATAGQIIKAASFSTSRMAMMGRARQRDLGPADVALQLIRRSASLQELAAVIQQPGAKDAKVLLQATLQVPRTVHTPLYSSEEIVLFPVLDSLLQGMEQHLPAYEFQDLVKVLGVCKLLRFVPQAFIESLTRRVLHQRGGLTLDQADPRDFAELLFCLSSMGSLDQRLAPVLADACIRQAEQLELSHLGKLLQVLVDNAAAGVDPFPQPQLHQPTKQGGPGGEPAGAWKRRLLTAVCGAAGQRLQAAGTKELAQLVSALARLPPGEATAPIVSKLPHAALRRLGEFSGWELTQFMRASAALGVKHPRLAQAAVAEATRRLQEQRNPRHYLAMEPFWGLRPKAEPDADPALNQQMVSKLLAAVKLIGPVPANKLEALHAAAWLHR